MNEILLNKCGKARQILSQYRGVLVAFSGGCDSSLLLRLAIDALGRDKVVAVTALSPTFPSSELEIAAKTAKALGAEHLLIDSSEMDSAKFVANSPERCYHCKLALFSQLNDIARQRGLSAIVEGSQLDDELDYRPGSKALKDFGIISPLGLAGFRKEEIREVSRSLGLATWNLPQQACLASRIPYGEKITKEKLELIEKSESLIKSLGFEQVRVRYHPGRVARVEINPDDLIKMFRDGNKRKISDNLKKFGFSYVAVDIDGYRQGSANEALMRK